jgi:hypothetical protein
METVTLELPKTLYEELQALATEEDEDLIEMLTRWAEQARQEQRWGRETSPPRTVSAVSEDRVVETMPRET